MKRIRVIWKDSRTYKTYVYRTRVLERFLEGGITDIPGDNNIYRTAENAHNEVDKILGGKTRISSPVRHRLGIDVICKKTEDNKNISKEE